MLRTGVVHLHLNSCFVFFANSWELQGCVCIFVCLSQPVPYTHLLTECFFFFFPIKSYGGAEKSLRGLCPCEPPPSIIDVRGRRFIKV